MADNDGQLVWYGEACLQFLGAGVGACVAKGAQAGYEAAVAAAPVSELGSHGNPPGYLRDSGYWAVYKNNQRILGMANDNNGDAVPPAMADLGEEGGDVTATFGFNAWYAGFVATGAGGRPQNDYMDVGIQAMQDETKQNLQDFQNRIGGSEDDPLDTTSSEASSALEGIIDGGSSLLEAGGEELIGLALL